MLPTTSEELGRLRTALVLILQPLTYPVANMPNPAQKSRELGELVTRLVNEVIDAPATPGDNQFLSTLAAALLDQPGLKVDGVISQIDELLRLVGFTFLQSQLEERERLKLGRKLSHQLTLLKMRLVQQNIVNQPPIVPQPAASHSHTYSRTNTTAPVRPQNIPTVAKPKSAENGDATTANQAGTGRTRRQFAY